MMSEKHPTGKHLPHPVKPVLLCSLIGAAAVALLLAGFSFLLTLQDLPHSAVEPLALPVVCWLDFSVPSFMDAAVCSPAPPAE